MFTNITKTLDAMFTITTIQTKIELEVPLIRVRRIPGPLHLQEEPLLGKRKEREWDVKVVRAPVQVPLIRVKRRIPGPEHLQEEPLLGKRKEREWDVPQSNGALVVRV